MPKAFWLLKTEPNAYHYDDLVRDGSTHWDGVRNYQARNNIKTMCPGDIAFIYHSVGPKEVVGIAEITSQHYPDPTDKEKKGWVVVDIKPRKKLRLPIHLEVFKNDKVLSQTPLVKQSRLSVVPLSIAEAKRLLSICGQESFATK